MGVKCICEICTCGRHRCPHFPKANVINKGAEPCNLTEYANVYKQHPFQARENFKPNQQPMKGGEFHDGTTHRQDFIKHPLEKPFVHTQELYKKPEGQMDGTTSYAKDYTEKYGAPAKPIRHEGKRQVDSKFEGTPTYRSDYKQWDLGGRQGPYMSQSQWEKPTQKFQGQSTMQHDFPPQYQARRPMMKPSEAARMSDARFPDSTGYRDSYIKHPMEKKFAHQPEVYKPPAAAFDGVTTFQRDFKGPIGEKTLSFKPNNQAFSSGQPLDDVTTNRNDFRKWPMERPFVHQQEGYKKPEGLMETSTTHNATYKEFPIQRAIGKRPTSATKMRNVPFDANTSYSQDYRKWDASNREKAKMRDEYQPTSAPFEGMSTQKAHFIPHSIQPSRSFKPDNSASQSDAPFDGYTMYRTDYTPKQIGICPAVYLDGPKTNYTFTTTDNRGHRLYQPVLETVTPLNHGKGQMVSMSVA